MLRFAGPAAMDVVGGSMVAHWLGIIAKWVRRVRPGGC